MRFQRLKWTFCVSAAAIFSALGLAASADEIKRLIVPQPYQEEVLADQYQNIAIRQDEILGIAESQVLPFYEFHVPWEDAQVNYRQGFDALLPAAYRPVFEKDGKTFVRFFAPKVAYVDIVEKFIAAYGPPVKAWAAARIQGKATYHLWDPADPQGPAIRIKIERTLSDGERTNNFGMFSWSVQQSKILARLESQRDAFPAAFYSEPFAAGTEVGGLTYANLMRVIPEEVVQRSANLSFMPLHGFLNSPSLSITAAQKGLSPREWLWHEYLPKLAVTLAHYNYELGVWSAAHTQNLSFLLDKETGEIKKFFLKDAGDVTYSLFAQALAGTLLEYDRDFYNVVNGRWYDSDLPLAKYAGYFAYYYSFQSVVGMYPERDYVNRRWNVSMFLRAYVESAGLELNHLSPRNQNNIDALFQLHEPEGATVEDYRKNKSEKSTISDYGAVFIQVVQEVADLKAQRGLDSIRAQAAKLTLSETRRLANIVRKAREVKHFNFATSTAEANLKKSTRLAYIPVRNSILVYNKSTGRALGVAYRFGQFETDFVNSTAARIAGNCDSYLTAKTQD